MARADSSPKAIVKAAIRTRCHVVAQRYQHQRLEKLHGSNVKWLVLSDELFDEVCSDFTIRKLDLDRAEKRALFDAEWVSQVTYELITKPARPRRGRQSSGDYGPASRSRGSVEDQDTSPRSSIGGVRTTSPPVQLASSWERDQFQGPSHGAGRHDSIVSTNSSMLPSMDFKTTPPHSPNGTVFPRPGWFDTVLN